MPDEFENLTEEYDRLEAESTDDKTLEEIRKLRAEHKRYRERFGRFATTFEGLPDGDVEALLSVAQALKAGQTEAVAKFFFDNARQLAGDTFDEWIDTKPEPAPEPEEVDEVDPEKIAQIVAEQVERKLAERDQLEQGRRIIESKLRELGYNDPSDWRAKAVLLRAQEIEGDPLEALGQAHEELTSHIQSEAQRLLSDKTTEAEPPPTPKGEPATGHSQLTEDMSLRDKIATLVDAAVGSEHEAFGS